MNVLIVEDDFVIQMFLEEMLKGMGHEVIGVFSDSDLVLSQINELQANVVIMDVGIKGSKDGVSLAKYLIEEYLCSIVFLTGKSDPVTIKQMEEVNPLGIFQKPIAKDKFIPEFERLSKMITP